MARLAYIIASSSQAKNIPRVEQAERGVPSHKFEDIEPKTIYGALGNKYLGALFLI